MLDLHTALYKWLKKAKLRFSQHNVSLNNTGTFFYRGFNIGDVCSDRVRLTWPARLNGDANNPWVDKTEILVADPKFFEKLKKAFKIAMTDINKVAINLSDLGPRKR